jgi:hypothetical protein
MNFDLSLKILKVKMLHILNLHQGMRGEDGEEEEDESKEYNDIKHNWKHGSNKYKGLKVMKSGKGQKGGGVLRSKLIALV